MSLAGRDPAELERLRAPFADPPSWRLDQTPADLLATAYGAAASLARTLALAGDTPARDGDGEEED